MKQNKPKFRASVLSLSMLALLSAETVTAEPKDWLEADGAMDALGVDVNKASFMKDWNLQVGGWINTSISANFNGSADQFNGPVTFNDRTGELQMNQLYLFFEKAVEANGDHFDWGGRVDFMYGTDSIFTQAYGSPAVDPLTGQPLNRGHWDLSLSSHKDRFYGIALPQAYAEFNLPIGNGLTVKAGHFYTIIGYEVVTAPDNFFITKPYTMQYGEPFTHTGVLASYTFNKNWSASAGAVTGSNTGGWDGGWDRDLGNWDFLGGLYWTSDDENTSLALTSTAGERAEDASSAWAIYSIVGQHNFTDKLHYVIQHDHGFADNVQTTAGLKNARWYGINQYLFYDMTEKLSVGVRAEWFRDQDGFRVLGVGRCGASTNSAGYSYACNGNTANYNVAGTSYYAVTIGLNYKPSKWITLRPNLRYDWADGQQAKQTFSDGTRESQLLFSTDMTLTF